MLGSQLSYVNSQLQKIFVRVDPQNIGYYPEPSPDDPAFRISREQNPLWTIKKDVDTGE